MSRLRTIPAFIDGLLGKISKTVLPICHVGRYFAPMVSRVRGMVMSVQVALILVDWDSARRIGNIGRLPRNEEDILLEIENAVEVLQEEVASVLNNKDYKDIIRVSWRIYHGWHEGEKATDDRKRFEKFISRYKGRAIGRISFGSDFMFGDDILSGSIRSPLRYTLRKRTNGNTGVTELCQKMVDTSLVSDLLHAARTRTFDRIIIVGDDDDLLPGIFTAECWGAHVHFIRINNSSTLPLIKGREKGFSISMAKNRGAN